MSTAATTRPNTVQGSALIEPGSLVDEPPYLLAVEQYFAMIDAGIFPEEAHVELWGGRIYEKMAKNIPHDISGNKATYALIRSLPPGWFVGNENTVVIGPGSAPLPDLVILRGKPDDYRLRRPQAGDVGLIIELAETSLRTDMGPKPRGYAQVGVAEYWVVNLLANVVNVFREPVPPEGRFGWARTYTRGESIHLRLGDEGLIALTVDDLVPAP